MVSVEIEKVENGYILRKTRGWTLTETTVHATFEELVTELRTLFDEHEKGH